jgi:hypothetical protein
MKLGEPTGTKAIISRAIVSGSSYKSVQMNNSALEVRNGYTSVATTSPGLQRDPSAWYHVVATVEDSVGSKIYVNGELFGSSNDTYHFLVSGQALSIGRFTGLTQSPFNGYLAEIHFSDGSVLDPDDFGEYNDSGVWVPKEATGITYGTHGFYLKFDPSAANGIGHDHSGNGNNFTATGFTTSGTGTDVMSDTPTTNYATFNPLSTRGATATYSEGNLKSVPNQYNQSRTTIPLGSSTGKFYAEATFDNFSSGSFDGEEAFAIQPTSIAQGTVPAHNSGILGIHKAAGTDAFVIKWEGTVVGSAGATQSGVSWTNLTIGLAINFDDQEISGYWNDSLVVGPVDVSTYLDTYDQWIFATTTHGAQPTITFNAGQRDFAYTLPTGFSALNTSNLPAPSIADGSQYFNTVLWTGNGSTQSITGVGFQPDWVWTKKRSSSQDHFLYDVVRGSTNGNFYELRSNSTVAEGVPSTPSTGLTSLDSDGFSIGSDASVNTNSSTYVAWNWLASNTSGSSNTDGTITSTISATPTGGFSIATFTGNGTAGATVGHGLGVEPKMVIWKSRNSGTTNDHWTVYHSGMDAAVPQNYAMHLNLTNARNAGTTYWNDTAPTSTVFSLGYLSTYINVLNRTYVAYCWAEVPGYSSFGSYVGNGNNDGPFVYTGFRPAFVMLKRTDSTSDWAIVDSSRFLYNGSQDYTLKPNLTNAEATVTDKYIVGDFLANGFKFRYYDSSMNVSGGTYVYMAFAEHPFGGANVSPSPAR